MIMDPFRTGGQGLGPLPHPGQLPRFVIYFVKLIFISFYDIN